MKFLKTYFNNRDECSGWSGCGEKDCKDEKHAYITYYNPQHIIDIRDVDFDIEEHDFQIRLTNGDIVGMDSMHTFKWEWVDLGDNSKESKIKLY